MEQIKELFDKKKDIYRTIEKVITYGALQEDRLNAEISEYIVTDHIDDDFQKLMGKMEAAMDSSSGTEIGVWVSGFYGSGKSSFTKYLGMALDDRITLGGEPFIKHLQDRMLTVQTKAQLGALGKKFPAAVVMLDLASEQVAGATMTDVSSVLFYKTLQWAGYSKNLKVAAFERKLQKDGRYDEFKQKVNDQIDLPWSEVQNDPLAVDSLIPDIAHEMYPKQFKTPSSFNTETSDFIVFENDRVEEMLEIVRETSGKDYVIFIIDEVGQYVGSRDNLILNLDGLAKNLKDIGDGKAWIIGTAQQTLTEDDPNAALNSDKLFKLKDRFPIQIELESSDIREICHRRLLSKSPEGEAALAKLFQSHGQALRTNTKLHDAKYYDSEFDVTAFTDLYPFLPSHFDILLRLLGALAQSTGGYGIRSAIKVIQDVLVEGPDEQQPVADNKIGWLANTVTFYDSLEKDIRRAFPSIYNAADKAISVQFPDSPIHQGVAKTVAILQILNDMPASSNNVTALMHPGIESSSQADAITGAITDLTNHPRVPFGDKDGSLCFFSEKLNEIERERADYPVLSIETKRVFNEALKELFQPLPSTRMDGNFAVSSGIKSMSATGVSSIAGERDTIQTIVEFVAPNEYEAARSRVVNDSRERASQKNIYLLGRTPEGLDESITEIFRCKEVAKRYRSDADQEIRDYCNSQTDRAIRLEADLRNLFRRSLTSGSFVFRADTTAVESINTDLLEACKKHLSTVAEKVYDRYAEAPHRAETTLAEKFLKLGNLSGTTAATDPLGLVKGVGGKQSVDCNHKAIVSIRDYIDRNGSVEGKRLIEHFGNDPFGWSQDTLRYLIAAMLCAGEIKLKVSGREVTVNGQQAIEALRTNNSFKKVGVSLRHGRPSNELLAKASERLTQLIGENVVPLEDEISKAVTKQFPAFQSRYSPLAEKLSRLGLPGAERIKSLTNEIDELLLTDASDAPQQLGSEESSIYNGLSWAKAVTNSLEQGLEATVEDLQTHISEVQQLPESGEPGQLKQELAESFDLVQQRIQQEDFYKHSADVTSALTSIKSTTKSTAASMALGLKKSIEQAQSDILNLPDWGELQNDEQSKCLAQIDALAIDSSEGLVGIKQILNQEYVIITEVNELKKSIEQRGTERRLQRLEQERGKDIKDGDVRKINRSIELPSVVASSKDLDAIIGEFKTVRSELDIYSDIELTITVKK